MDRMFIFLYWAIQHFCIAANINKEVYVKAKGLARLFQLYVKTENYKMCKMQKSP